MAVATHWYTQALVQMTQNNLFLSSWAADPIYVALVSSAYTVNKDSDATWSIPQRFEISGAGYTAGGVALTGKSLGNITNSTVPLLASPSFWTNATFACRYAVIYRATETSSTSPLLGWSDFGAIANVISGLFAINWDGANGVLALNAG